MLSGAMENEHISRKEIQRSSARRSRVMRKIGLWGLSLAILVGIGWGMVKLSANVQIPVQSGALAVPVSASDHIFGPDTAPQTLVEYSDYQCPACGAFYPLIKQVLADPAAQGKVRFVYRNFPLTSLHANAQLAAQAAEAAALQGKFWEMHDALFEGQSKWSGMSSSGARGQFVTYAQALKLDMTRFQTDIDSTAVKNTIKADQDGGLAAGVNATPTFYVNGVKMPPPQNYDQFKSYILNGIK